MAADPGATTALPDDVKKNLKSIVLELRHLFEADLGLGLKRLGIDAETGTVTPADDPTLSYLNAHEREQRGALDAVLAKETTMTKDVPEAVRALLREAAYTHLNRLIGLKCLELRGHLTIDGERTEVVTQRKDYGGLSKYLWTLRSRDACLLGDPELLWREGLLRACASASAVLGVLFDPEDPYAQVWPSYNKLVQAVRTLDELPEGAFRADELLGWVYQYFQSEEKDRVFAEVKTKKRKIAWSDIVPVTQVYTERYMVDFLLQNSLGARWMEMYPGSRAKEVWPYYVAPATPHSREPQAVKEWTVLDLCCGAGHFLVVAFDLLAQLYAEERALAEQGLVPSDWAVPEAEVARTILERNLHGIDIDPRAVQLSALALYLKAKELGLEGTPQMRLVIADCVLQRGERYQALLDTYKDDPAAIEAIEAIWRALEHVRDLGSLVRIEEEVEAAVQKARKRSAGSFSELADWAAYKAELVARLKSALATEASSRDERQLVFGTEVKKGLALFEMLSERYDVVCTNPPYMGSKNMGVVLKEYVGLHYSAGKRDIYAAFVLRARGLSRADGHVAMVTQQSWMFLKAFQSLRCGSVGRAAKETHGGLLRDASLRVLAHLGSGGFSEIGGEVVNTVLLVLRAEAPAPNEAFVAIRAVAGRDPAVKRILLERAAAGDESSAYVVSQHRVLSLPGAPLSYWLGEDMMAYLAEAPTRLGDQVEIKKGTQTADNNRFMRQDWEIRHRDSRWFPFAKGGGYRKWSGNADLVVDWQDGGRRIKDYICERYPYLRGQYGMVVRNEESYFRPGATYGEMCSGSLSLRVMPAGWVFSSKGPGVFAADDTRLRATMALLSSRVTNHILRSIVGAPDFSESYIQGLPAPGASWDSTAAARLATVCIDIKELMTAAVPTESTFRNTLLEPAQMGVGGPAARAVTTRSEWLAAVLHSVEGRLEFCAGEAFGLGAESPYWQEILAETGTPADWHPLLPGYDTVEARVGGGITIPPFVAEYLSSKPRLALDAARLREIRTRLREFYTAGPGSKPIADEQKPEAVDDADEVAVLGAGVPIPPETFLEELSQKLEIHPVSVYRLLAEMRDQERLVCPSETKRETEDWLSVKLLRMLGHRWPQQDQYEEEEGKRLLEPAWVDEDGIVTLTQGMGEETFSERLRRLLDAEAGSDGGHKVEVELTHTLGWKPGTEWGRQKPLSLGDWFKRDFFRRHVSQFKRRPIAWHLRSPKATVQMIVYYHAFNRDRLALLRARYLGNLRQELNGKRAAAEAKGYEDRANVARVEQLEERLSDLGAFDDKLARLQEGREREARIWCPWKTPEEQPQGWDPDINDGVRVNIAPLQRLGLLASDVLAKKDLKSLLAPEERG